MTKPKILFIGTPQIAADVLVKLLDNDWQVSAVVTQPDRPQGRSKQPVASPVKVMAEDKNIAVYQPESRSELTKVVKDLQPNLVIVIAYGKIIEKEALEIPTYGIINLHYSLLPQYRGAAPYVDSILNGDEVSGVSIIKMAEGLDDGDIIVQEKLALTGQENASDLLMKLNEIGAELLIKILPDWLAGKIIPQKQTGETTKSKIINKEDGKISWSQESATAIERKVRAYSIWPNAYTFLGNKQVKITGSSICDDETNLKPGEIEVKNYQIIVGTAKGCQSIERLKLEGKKEMTAKDAVNGNLIKNGDCFS